MNPQLRNQLLIGVLAGFFVSVVVYFVLGGKRTERDNLVNSNQVLRTEVAKGNNLKAHYEKLKKEVDQLQARIDELIKIMPSDLDRNEIPYRVKKLADTAGIDQISFKFEGQQKRDYYTEYSVTFRFRAGYHTFGQFASLVSGNDKIINLNDIVIARDGKAGTDFPATVSCRISAFIYNPEEPKAAPKPAAPKASASADKD